MGNVNESESFQISSLHDVLSDLIDIQEKEFSTLTMERIVECILNLILDKNVNWPLDIFRKLITVVMHNNASESSPGHNQRLLANILECIHLQVTKFPSAEWKLFLKELWIRSKINRGDYLRPLSGQILVKLFDDFVRELGLNWCGHLVPVINDLLLQGKKDRQVAYILMHKLEEIFDTNNDVADIIKCTKQQWTDYIDVVEHLEKQKMPSNLLSFFDIKSEPQFIYWIHVIYKRSLQSDNIFVNYKAVKYIVAHLNISQLTDWDLMKDFLAATNRTQLYNVDDDDRSYPLFKNFVSNKELKLLMQALVTVPWKWNSITLFEWLRSLPEEELGQRPSISEELLLKLGLRIQDIENSQLMDWAQCQVIIKFEATINGLSFGDYLIFIEIMYKNRSNEYRDHECLKYKLIQCTELEMLHINGNKPRWDIIFNSFIKDDLIIVLIDKLKQIPKPHHGWLRFFPLYFIKQNQHIADFYSTEYRLNIPFIQNVMDLKKLQKYLIDKLMCKSNEKSLVLAISMDLFTVNQIKNWNQMEKFQLKPLKILQQGRRSTFKHLAHLLENCSQRLEDENVLPAFVALLKKYPDCDAARGIGKYASKHLTIEEQNALALEITSHHLHINLDIVRVILKSSINVAATESLQKLFNVTSLTDDMWLDAIYLDHIGIQPVLFMFVQYALGKSESYIYQVAEELLRINKKLTKTQPYYLFNSKVHIMKFYIAEALIYLKNKLKFSDQLWSALFQQLEQFNITCMYELIVASTLPKLELLLQRLQWISTLELNQQISLLSVTNIYLHLNWNTLTVEEHKKLFDLLMTLSNKEELVKLALHKLTPIYDKIGFHVPNINTPQTSVEVGEARLEASFLIPKVYALAAPIEDRVLMNYGYIFFMSNLQPYTSFGRVFSKNFEKMQEFRRVIKSLIRSFETQELMNISPKHQYRSVNDADLIVVASFIDDLTNLNGLIQTCKALRVRTLILSDSTSLRPENEDSLNIVEMNSAYLQIFLSKKKLRNYYIVATKKHGESADFIKFSFAKKTILLIGHEQNGIPEELTYLLDKTVELPQTDYQYSQNLLIFVYHKQYIAYE